MRASFSMASFNASKLSSVKMVLQHADQGLEISRNPPQLPHQPPLRSLVLRDQGQARRAHLRPVERIGDGVGIARHLGPPPLVERRNRPNPLVEGHGNGEAPLRKVDELHGNRPARRDWDTRF